MHPGELDLATLTPYIGPPVRRQEELAPVTIWTSPAGQDAGRLRPEPGGLGARPGPGPGRHRDHAAARRGARARRARRPAAADRQGHGPSSSSAVARTSSSRPSPSTASATPRSRAGRADRGAPVDPDALTAVVVSLRAAPDRRLRVLRRAAQPVAPQRGLGHCGATSSTCRPTARSATSGWAGPVTSPSSRPSAAYLFDVDGFLRDWLRDLAAEQQAADGMVASSCPMCSSTCRAPKHVPDAGQHGDLERRRGLGAVGALAGLRRPPGARATSSTRWPLTSAGSRPCCPPTGLWDTGFQFGDWLDPTAPPDEPFRRQGRQRRGGHRLPLPQRPHRSPRRPSSSAEPTDAEHFAELADRTRAAFNEHYVQADGTIHSDAEPPCTRWPSSSACSTSRPSSSPASGWRSWSPRRLPHPDRLRRHALRHRRPDQAPATSTTPTGCCCSASARPGSTPSPWEPRRSGSAGTRCCPTAPSTPAR